VRLSQASHNTIWVEWDEVENNSNGYLLSEQEKSKVTYLLWITDGFEPLHEGDRVIVKVPMGNFQLLTALHL
jgi:hypothetical protein